jgi:predicted ferric reductase
VGGIALLNLLILAAVFGSIDLLFWPVAALAVLGMAGALYVVNLVVVAVVMGYANVVTRLSQLARPATLALLPTLLLLGGFAWLRAWLAGKGLAI